MLVLKYSKTGDAKYIPHVDTLRILTRTFRRMGLNVEYSKGFNPHMLLNMSPPLPVGIESKTEFVEIAVGANCVRPRVDGDIDLCKLFIDLFNNHSPDGFKALKVRQVEKSPKITANTTMAEYTAIRVATGCDPYIFTIPCGNKNLRADKYLLSIGVNPADVKITRTKLFAGDEKLILMDDLF